MKGRFITFSILLVFGVTAAPAPSDSTGARVEIRATSGLEDEIRYLGRVNPATRELTWPGTGLEFSFTGTSATIGILDTSGTNSFSLEIDGATPTIINNVAPPNIKTPELANGNHTVVLRRRDEPQFGRVFLGDVTTDGSFIKSTALARQIEIIGDSISVGYGLDGVNPCVNDAAVTDNPKTYGALAATALGADYSVIAWSGKGVVRNIATGAPDDSPLIPELYTKYGANDATGSYTFPPSWSPNAVVIGLGTNDFNYFAYTSNGSYKARESLDPSTFTAGMVEFVQSIQTHYPEARFFLSSSPMLSDSYPAGDAQKTTQVNALKDAVEQLGGEKVHFVDWPTQGDDVGCDFHPNAATNAAQADVLAAAISAALGW